MTIYLSSTYEDLKDYRRVVFDSLRKAGHHVIAMEDYVAADQRPVVQCLADVEKADIYVGLFAFRYGDIPSAHHQNPGGLSITEMEFRRAETLHKPCLTFVVSDTTAWPPVFDDAYTSEDKGDRIKALRKYVLTEKLASAFSSPHELAALVLAAVTKHLECGPEVESSASGPRDPVTAVPWDIEKNGSPYPGLMHFTRKYAPVFFGRDAEVRDILDRMRAPDGRFIIISGDSGVGKSSVIDAGVLPRIEETLLPGSKRALCVRMLPSQGRHPFSALMGALHPYATRADLKPEAIAEELIQSPQKLAGRLRAILSNGTEHDALVLFMDQMEELFTAQTPEESKTFLGALYAAAQEAPLWVLGTIRSDHLHHCHGHPDMLRVLRGPGHYPLGPVEPFMLLDMIVKPARCAGLKITEELARRIVDETGSGPSYLPLLAFVLNQLFEKRPDHELNEAVYKSVGGVAGAIAQHAQEVEASIRREQGAKAAALLPKLFHALVIVNSEGLPTRRRPLRSEFSPEMSELMNVLVRERLLHTEGEGRDATVSISHEKLFEAWPSLCQYVAANKKQLMDQTLLENRARKWTEMGRPWFSGLASGREYQDFCRAEITATPDTKDYLLASCRACRCLHGSMGLVIFFIVGTTWLWQEGFTLDQAILKAKSAFVTIHVEPDELATIPGGTFQHGDLHDFGEGSEQPAHEVTIKPFAMAKYQVTFEEYDRFALATGRPLPSDEGWGRGRRPVINVSWLDAKAYAGWLSQATGKRYRLPTEAEWEYAARSGGGKEIWSGTSDRSQLPDYAVYAANSQRRTAPVGRKKPNGLGLYDMSGNAWDWVEDCWRDDYAGAPTDGSAWLEAENDHCDRRVIRGGSWAFSPKNLRASHRSKTSAGDRSNGIGFRLVREIEPA